MLDHQNETDVAESSDEKSTPFREFNAIEWRLRRKMTEPSSLVAKTGDLDMCTPSTAVDDVLFVLSGAGCPSCCSPFHAATTKRG